MRKVVTMAHDKWANPQKMWDERFSLPEPVYGEEPNEFLASQSLRFKPGMKLLVPADGYGRNGIWLAKRGFQVHTVDLSPVGVERARRAAHAAGVEMTIECADLSNWNWPESQFDGVLAIYLHLPADVRKKAHKGMLGGVRQGGLIILEAFSTAQLRHSSGGPKQAELLYTAELLRDDFSEAEVVELDENEIHVSEGPMHSGKAAVVRAVFRRVK